MGLFSPAYSGTIELPSVPSDFTEKIAHRVETGLLAPGSRRRANYVVCSKTAEAITFMAVGFWTAYNLGLNYVVLNRSGDRAISYRVKFWRWALYAAIQGLLVSAAVLVAVLLVPGGRAKVESYSQGWQMLGFLLVFYGLFWPWVLVAMHRRFAAGALERIVREAVAA
jgi:hypothetical protein